MDDETLIAEIAYLRSLVTAMSSMTGVILGALVAKGVLSPDDAEKAINQARMALDEQSAPIMEHLRSYVRANTPR